MNIIILCDQEDCKFNKVVEIEGKNLKVRCGCTHPNPELSYNIRQDVHRNCMSKTPKV